MASDAPQAAGNVAVFVDGDNATPRLLKAILEEVSKYGTPTVRRIYGDWTSQNMQSWKQSVLANAFRPIQQYNVAKGKNSTDAALIIDAMDVLYQRDVDVFCIVSSDSDFTSLAQRLREAGKHVVGIGERKTPESLVNACHTFVYTQNLDNEDPPPAKGAATPAPRRSRQGLPLKLLRRTYAMVADDSGWAELGHLGNKLKDLDPGFDPRTWGHQRLLDLLEASGRFDVQAERGEGPSPVYVRIKP